ncbi:recombination regulator RecX [Lactobacillus selangorensis]|nr:recombination regulator RecX [Lactobacillus selangorensis]
MTKSEITKITTQKQKGRYNIFVDDEYAFSVGESVLIRYRLAKGLEVTPELRKQLEDADHFSRAYQLALHYLEHQLRTRWEIQKYLRDHEVSPAYQKQILYQLAEMGYVDDLHYAKSYVRTAANTSTKGPTVIRRKLREKGVKDDVIDAAMQEFQSDKRRENGLKLAQKLAKRYHRRSFVDQKRRVKQGLMTNGFSGDDATAIMEKLDLERDENAEDSALATEGEKVYRRYARRYEGRERDQKIKQALYRKGFTLGDINSFLAQKEDQNDN